MLEEKKSIGTLFDGIAGTYDMLNHLLSLNIDKSWRRRTVQKLTHAQNLLDVAIGTADLSLEIMRQQKATKIQGIDVSREMMRIGKEKVSKVGFAENIRFDYGSALEMPYADNTFDALTCAYGLRNFPDADKGLAEFYRVMQPGAQLAILEFSYPENRVIRFGYDLFFTHVLPFVGRVFSHDKSAYTYLNRSVKEFMWGEEMVSHIQNAGFKNVRFQPLTFGITTVYTATK
ncbi:bifunctional demethylmenaquinone methyltransferase/2-methoxy-6-polyprenyl-1,4-benzoquinol methylase UbiE [Prevotella sp. PINT]|jgi:ubiquinone/menaquinone biosynthesis methyltransferases|uniref:bifunctional demethylmenaquinone methyltransferase/2-methoxy-6-polyprenyl-1,4-benzoquinol methylase UbiE n=1 Tax=Palleniella intestinalis TaxID=2736291 RepID=UPI00155510BA|nr:bifunctional demethylmenaquinone methyltransferase/2-methoxy-6-polyprenyl-1,4-benzoquinol methylase UbiE [Palleniella intestinalis]NPD80481.1 bifunctional demethylmenaquinone methyltransferase/2-methoxy-6-polyprenyl-1,4-benzoquinol methylase UbiE [Palleniella intestinalis]